MVDDHCDACGNPFKPGETVTRFWNEALYHTITVHNTEKCRKRGIELVEAD